MRLILRPAVLAVVLFFIPKVNFLAVGGETAGIRFDDLLIFAIALCLFGCWLCQAKLRINRLAWSCFALIGAFCLSNVLNLGHSSVFYSLRIMEYLVFLWVGDAFAEYADLQALVKGLILINCGLILLQAFHLIGAFTAEGYVAILARPSGLANHPAEMGAWLNLMFAALVFGGRVRFWWWGLLVLFCIFLTASRIALLTHCILMVIYVYRSSRRKRVLLLRSALLAGLLISAVAFIPNPVRDRSSDVLSLDNLSTFADYYNVLPAETQFIKFSDAADPESVSTAVDPSWLLRVVKWTQVVKLYVNSTWLTKLFGIGPGTLGPALDGGWLRLVVECGLFGAFVFVMMLRKIASLSPACSMAVLSLSINMTLIDSHIAYKVMAFLFFLAGYTYRSNMVSATGQASLPDRFLGPLSSRSLQKTPLTAAGPPIGTV